MNKLFWIVFVVMIELSAVFSQESKILTELYVAPYQPAVLTGELANKKLDEVSGITASSIHNDVLWVHNDSGSKPRIYAIGTDGSDLGDFFVDGANCRDWEDISSFIYKDEPWLLIADTGDNDAVHKKCFLYIVREPDVKDPRFTRLRLVPVYTIIEFTWEDGPRDCEAVAVDTKRNKILLVSKRTSPSSLYELDLVMDKNVSTQIAVKICDLSGIPKPMPEELLLDKRFGVNSAQPTAMDISPDGKFALVLTYKNAFLYTFNNSWAETFSGFPERIKVPLLSQSESVCFAKNSYNFYITSENRPAPLYLLKLDH